MLEDKKLLGLLIRDNLLHGKFLIRSIVYLFLEFRRRF